MDKLKLSGRSAEIQRLIGRSLRAAVDMAALGERTITVDCDVLQGDGGTRTASVTGGFVALALACRKLVDRRRDREACRMLHYVAGVSAGIVDDVPLLDLQYSEDSRAQVDLNCIMNGAGTASSSFRAPARAGAFTAGRAAGSWWRCAPRACGELLAKQKEILGEIL